MPKRYGSKHVVKVAEKLGFIFMRQKGSHMFFRHQDGRTFVTAADKKELPIGTFCKILKDMNTNLTIFESLLK